MRLPVTGRKKGNRAQKRPADVEQPAVALLARRSSVSAAVLRLPMPPHSKCCPSSPIPVPPCYESAIDCFCQNAPLSRSPTQYRSEMGGDLNTPHAFPSHRGGSTRHDDFQVVERRKLREHRAFQKPRPVLHGIKLDFVKVLPCSCI